MLFDLGAFQYVAAFLLALGLSLYFTPLVRRGALRYGVVDIPDGALKAHKQPIPYLGGVAVYLAFLLSVAATYFFTAEVLGLLLGSSIVVMLGLFDDLKVLSPTAKLVGQGVAALVLMKAGIMIRLTFLPEWLAAILTVLWLVGVTNAFNLIDVSDGLAAGVAAIAGFFLSIVSLWSDHSSIVTLALALVGACCGFLAFNRPPARIYLGDTGSMFIGFTLGALAMSGNYTLRHTSGAIAPVVILGVPIFDTLFVIGVRLVRKIPIMQGSPDHFAVRLRNNGVGAGAIAGGSYLVATALGVLGLFICQVPQGTALILIVGLAVLVGLVVLGLWRIGRGPGAPDLEKRPDRGPR